jgi:hypothetical protein
MVFIPLAQAFHFPLYLVSKFLAHLAATLDSSGINLGYPVPINLSLKVFLAGHQPLHRGFAPEYSWL